VSGVGVPAAAADPRPGATQLVSVATDGSSADADATSPSMSSDGRFVAFSSGARNLVEGSPGNLYDVYVRDRLLGTTELVSVGNDGEPREGWSLEPDVSGDGRYVAFTTSAAFDDRDTNRNWDVYVRDRHAGTTTLASLSANAQPIDWGAGDPEISDDGRIVTFSSGYTDVVPGDTNSTFDVFARDMIAGTTELVSIGTDGSQLPTETYWHEMSADGRFVTLDNFAPVEETDGVVATWQIFVRDRLTGKTHLVSKADDGTAGNATSYDSNISANGQVVSFVSYASNLAPGNMNVPHPEVYVHDRATDTTERACVGHDGADPNGACFTNALSPEGRYVAFDSAASNLIPE
jgi:Tol biopolymer transport system component